MYDYSMSEQLFLDVWKEYGCPNELYDRDKIYNFLSTLVERSKTHIVLDHYSCINFDYVSKIEKDGEYIKIYWYDKNSFREKYLAKAINKNEMLAWSMFDCYTYVYILLDIQKIRFIRRQDHLFILLLSNIIQYRDLKKKLSCGNEMIKIEKNTSDLYTQYIFFEGDSSEFIKHSCIASDLPYYSCIIQPKQNIPNVLISKGLLLLATIDEVKQRLTRVRRKLDIINEHENDDLFAVGNTIRTILECFLKYYCVIRKLDLAKIDINQKYGYISLSELKKAINRNGEINISQSIIDTANEMSHDSGKKISKEIVSDLCHDVMLLFDDCEEVLKKHFMDI